MPARRVALRLQLQFHEAGSEEDLGAGGANLGRRQRLDQRGKPARRDEGIAVHQGHVVHPPEITDTEIRASGEAGVARAAHQLHLGIHAGDQVGAPVRGGVVDHDDLQLVAGPFRRQQMVETALDQGGAVVVHDHDAHGRLRGTTRHQRTTVVPATTWPRYLR